MFCYILSGFSISLISYTTIQLYRNYHIYWNRSARASGVSPDSTLPPPAAARWPDTRDLDKRAYLMIIEGYFFLCLIETICCDPSSEPSRRDGSGEGPQHMLLYRTNKKYP